MCNPNLLINTDFKNPVNQRGQSEYTDAWKYCIDQWLLGGDGQVYVNDGYLKIIGAFDQYINYKVPEGIAITFSIKLLNGNIYNKTFVMGEEEQTSKIEGTEIYATLFAGETPDNSKYTRIRFYFPLQETESNSVLSVKIELGSFSTLANEVVDYAAELRKCQRYLQKGTASFNTEFEGSVVYIPTGLLENTMRIAPTVRYYTKFGEGTVVNGHDNLYGKINGIFESKINRLPAIDVDNPAKIEDLVICEYIASAEL